MRSPREEKRTRQSARLMDRGERPLGRADEIEPSVSICRTALPLQLLTRSLGEVTEINGTLSSGSAANHTRPTHALKNGSSGRSTSTDHGRRRTGSTRSLSMDRYERPQPSDPPSRAEGPTPLPDPLLELLCQQPSRFRREVLNGTATPSCGSTAIHLTPKPCPARELDCYRHQRSRSESQRSQCVGRSARRLRRFSVVARVRER